MVNRFGTKLRRKGKKAAGSSNAKAGKSAQTAHSEADVSPWTEALFAAEILILHATPIYYGFGVPRGDDSAVIIIPGFLGTDLYLMELHAWLGRIGYRPYFSGIGINADCPNLLIQRHVSETVERALRETGRKIHLIGHSLGGVIARSIVGERPKDVTSVITLASPIRGTVANRSVVHAADAIRLRILQEHGKGVLPTATPDAAPVISLTLSGASSRLHAPDRIYTRDDGIVDWRYCRTRNPEIDFEVPGTHIGMAFNPSAYAVVAQRLAKAQRSE